MIEAAAGPGAWARFVHRVRTEGNRPERIPWAMAVGVFLGCTPFYGFHWALCLLAGGLLGLNRLQVYAAANLSNPLLAPLLVFAEVQAGAWLRRGHAWPLERGAFANLDPWMFGGDLLVGSLAVGLVLALLAGLAAFALIRRSGLAPDEHELVEAAALRHLGGGIGAWEFARGKLRLDPVYLELLRRRLVPEQGVLLDLGCGRGLLLGLVASARLRAGDRRPLALLGIENDARAARAAARALAGNGEVVCADLRDAPIPACDAAALLDVLHYLEPAAQDELVARAASALRAGGRLLIREADAGGGRGFTLVRWSERLRALLRGRPRTRFAYRRAGDWAALLASHGLEVERLAMGRGTPFANVLVVARKSEMPPPSSATA